MAKKLFVLETIDKGYLFTEFDGEGIIYGEEVEKLEYATFFGTYKEAETYQVGFEDGIGDLQYKIDKNLLPLKIKQLTIKISDVSLDEL